MNLTNAYQQVRNRSIGICSPLRTEDYVVQPVMDVSPIKWHLGHSTWFFETFILTPHMSRYSPFDAQFGSLFNSYYKRLGHHPDRATRGTFSRPRLDEVHAYRAYVDDNIHELNRKWKRSSYEMYLVKCGARTKVSKNQVVWARCHFDGLASGMD